MKTLVISVAVRPYVAQPRHPKHKGNGRNPICNFCTSPAEFVATGEKQVGGGIFSFYECVCVKDAETLRKEEWPVNRKLSGELTKHPEESGTTNTNTNKEATMPATTEGSKNNSRKPSTLRKTVAGKQKADQPRGKTFSQVICEKMGAKFHTPAEIIALAVKAFPDKKEKTVTANTRWYINKMKGDKTLIQNVDGQYKVRAGK